MLIQTLGDHIYTAIIVTVTSELKINATAVRSLLLIPAFFLGPPGLPSFGPIVYGGT